jgi:hypothetical protein
LIEDWKLECNRNDPIVLRIKQEIQNDPFDEPKDIACFEKFIEAECQQDIYERSIVEDYEYDEEWYDEEYDEDLEVHIEFGEDKCVIMEELENESLEELDLYDKDVNPDYGDPGDYDSLNYNLDNDPDD